MLLRTVLTAAAASSRLAPHATMTAVTGASRPIMGDGYAYATDVVPLADFEALQAELERVRLQLSEAQADLKAAGNEDTQADYAPDEIEKAFTAVDDNGDGVLTLEEFRKGYALLTGDAVARMFDQMDADHNGTVDKDGKHTGSQTLGLHCPIPLLHEFCCRTLRVQSSKRALRF